MNQLLAEPIFNSCGYLIESYEDFQEILLNSDIKPEFKLTLVVGSVEDQELFKVCKLDASGLQVWFDEVEPMLTYEKAALFYLMEICGFDVEVALSKLEQVDVRKGTLLEAATEIFDEYYLAEIPEAVQGYVNYEQFAYDGRIGGDLYEFTFANESYTCTNAHSH